MKGERSRQEKAAAGLIAIRRALERSGRLDAAGDEFFRLYDWIAAADPRAFTKVWADPSSHYWASLAYRRVRGLLAECRAGGPPSDAARQSALSALARFKAIVLGVAMTAQRDVAFDRPWAPPLPLSIPGTRLTVLGTSGATLSGARSGSIVCGDGATVAIEECPAVSCGAHEIFLKPSAFDLPEFEFFAPLRDLPSGFQVEQVDALGQALAILERHSPDAYRDLGDIVRVIAFKPEDLGDYTNVSHAELPGAFILTAVGDPYVLAAGLVHELHHNKLFLVEDQGAFLGEGAATLGAEGDYYSPFREDLRPIGGVLHGLYVFVPTLDYWIAVHQSGELRGDRARFVAARIPYVLGQLEIAVFQLERHGRFSAAGAKLLGSLKQDVERLRREVDRLNLPADLPFLLAVRSGGFSEDADADDGHVLTPREALLRHIDRYDARDQCVEIRASLAAGLPV